MDTKHLDALGKKLDVIIYLLLRNAKDNELSLRSQIKILDGLGCRPIEIAKILGKAPNYVTKELVATRKDKKL